MASEHEGGAAGSGSESHGGDGGAGAIPNRDGDGLVGDPGPDFPDPDGDWAERRRYWMDEAPRRAVEGKLAAVFGRMRERWARLAEPGKVSRLDGGRTLTDAEWAALGDTALFAKLLAAGIGYKACTGGAECIGGVAGIVGAAGARSSQGETSAVPREPAQERKDAVDLPDGARPMPRTAEREGARDQDREGDRGGAAPAEGAAKNVDETQAANAAKPVTEAKAASKPEA